MNVSRIDRLYVDLEVTGTLRGDNTPIVLSGVDIALLPPRGTPTGDTVWTAADYTDGVANVLLAGPDAEPAGALVVPEGGADLWIKIADDPETLTAKVERITVS